MRRERPRAWVVLCLGGLLLAGCGKREARKPEGQTEVAPPSQTLPPPLPEADRPLSAQTLPDAPEQSLEELLARKRTPDVELALGHVYFRQDALDSAIVHYRRGAEGEPRSTVGWNYLGIALARAGRYEEAEQAYHRALSADAYNLETHINLGNLSFRRENWEGAIREYRLASTIDSTEARVWLNLGMALERTGEDDQAARLYHKVAEKEPMDPLPWELLGNLYYRQQLHTGAVESWKKVVALDPTREDLVEHIEAIEAWQKSLGSP